MEVCARARMEHPHYTMSCCDPHRLREVLQTLLRSQLPRRGQPGPSGATDPRGEIAFTRWIFQYVAIEEQEIASLKILEGSHRVLAVGPKCFILLFIVIYFFLRLPHWPVKCVGHLAFWTERHLKKNGNRAFTFFKKKFSINFVTSAICKRNVRVV